MKKTSCIVLALTVSLGLTACAEKNINIGEAARITSTMAAPDSSMARSAELIGKLSELNITSEQAVGGTGALLDLARNRLSGNDYSQLLQSAPALKEFSGNGLAGHASTIGGLLGGAGSKPESTGVQSLAGVAEQFSSLGMDSGMISQFAPVLLDFIGNQGVGQPLLGTLTSLWTAQ